MSATNFVSGHQASSIVTMSASLLMLWCAARARGAQALVLTLVARQSEPSAKDVVVHRPSRSLETWASYLRAVLPLLLPRIEALQLVCVRRARFMNYMRRDRELDRICHDLCGDKPTIVAFGAANACSTGFGYAPAPQRRLRHRLRHVHGAKVCLIDEYKTSQLCCGCGNQLCLVEEPGRQNPVWHVKRCLQCKNRRGAPLTRHRDVNAALNIMAVYMQLATNGKRPVLFTRPRKPKKRVESTPPGSAARRASGGLRPASPREPVNERKLSD